MALVKTGLFHRGAPLNGSPYGTKDAERVVDVTQSQPFDNTNRL